MQSAERFDQRPRIDAYDDFVYLVARGADPEHTGDAEVHCFWTDRYVVTVHRGRLPGGRARAAVARAITPRTGRLARDRHRVSRHGRGWWTASSPSSPSSTTGSTRWRTTSCKAPTEAQLGELFDMKRSLMEMRKIVAPRARHDGQHQRRA